MYKPRKAVRRQPSSRCFELSGTLPFGLMRQPSHEPIVWLLIAREMRGAEEGYIGLGQSLLRWYVKTQKLTVDEVRPEQRNGEHVTKQEHDARKTMLTSPQRPTSSLSQRCLQL
jgi:hypothetical protein